MTDASSRPADAQAVLHAGNASVALLVSAYRTLCERGPGTEAEKLAIVDRLNLELTLHAQVEQELIDPALRLVADDTSLMHSARDAAWALVAHLSSGDPGEPRFDVRLLLMADDLARQWSGAEREIERRLQAAHVDTHALGLRIIERQRELLQAYGEPLPGEALEDEEADPVGPSQSSS